MQDKRIIVTGGFGALGSAVGRAAVTAGARVALIDHAKKRRGGGVKGALDIGDVDLRDASSAQEGIAKAVAAFEGLDGIVNVAGGFAWETLEEGALETWDRLYALNVKTAVTATKAALPHLLESPAGRVINVGAAGALKAGAGFGAYTASKSGVMRFTESLAEELKPTAVTVNAVLPSILDTPANRAEMGDAHADKWVKLEELAAVILFLLSDEARAVTGALVPVTGRV